MAIALATAIVVFGAARLGAFDGLGRWTVDARLRADDLAASRRGDTTSQTVVICEVSAAERASWRSGEPGARAALADLLRWLHRGRPAAVVLSIPLETPGEDDEKLAAAIRESQNVVLRGQVESPRPTQVGLTRPVRVLREAAAGKFGYAPWATDEDQVARQVSLVLPDGFELNVATVAWAVAHGLAPSDVRQALIERARLPGHARVPGDLRVHLLAPGPPGTGYAVVRPTDFRVPPEVAGKIVVVGTRDLTVGSFTVPLSACLRPDFVDKYPEPASLTELMATAIHTLMLNRQVLPVSSELHFLLAVLLAAVAGCAAAYLSTRRGLIVVAVLLLGWQVASVLLWRWLILVPLGEAWTAVVVAYGVTLFLRLNHDLRDQRVKTEHAERERLRLAELDSAKRAVLSTVVHDLKVPVAIIKGQALTLVADPTRELGDEIHQEFLETMAGQCDRMTSMIEDILDTDPQRALTIVREVTDVQRLVRHVLEMHSATASRHTLRLESSEPCQVPLDAVKVTRVLNNLVANAIKYSPDGGEVTVSIARNAARELVIGVRDQGIGMTPEQASRLFGLFARVLDDPGRIPGTGIGLYSSKRLAEAHGGRFEVDSTPGVGTEFRLLLPIPDGA